MPRKPRFFVPGLPAHVIQRGNNRQAIFFDDADYRLYLSLLGDGMDRYGCSLHTYVLMTNHVHLLMTPSERDSISRIMQYVGRHYVPYFNRKYRRTGTLWEGRFRASIVDSSAYLLACYRYIELNPVRARMVEQPGDYAWSSFLSNGLGRGDALITAHPEYLNLGESPSQRAENYCLLFQQPITDAQISSIRDNAQSGTPLGGSRFREEIEAALSVSVGKAHRGRPKVLKRTKGL